jgi:hypothetical protein
LRALELIRAALVFLFVGNVAMPIVYLVALKLMGRDWMLGVVAVIRHRTPVAMVYVVVVIDMAGEMFRTVVPRACTNENAAGKPFGAVVAIGGAAIGGVIVVTVGAHWGGANRHADLSLCLRSTCYKAQTGDSS